LIFLAQYAHAREKGCLDSRKTTYFTYFTYFWVAIGRAAVARARCVWNRPDIC
jgi:hypothetical protein